MEFFAAGRVAVDVVLFERGRRRTTATVKMSCVTLRIAKMVGRFHSRGGRVAVLFHGEFQPFWYEDGREFTGPFPAAEFLLKGRVAQGWLWLLAAGPFPGCQEAPPPVRAASEPYA